MEGIGAEVSQKVKSAIKAKLVELGVYVDEELPDYIMVMVANKRSKSEMIEDLQLFLGTHTEKFISWLLQVLQKLHEVTVASLDAKRASTSSSVDKEKEKTVKKKKLPSAEGEPESAKKDRKKKAETTKKDSGGKKAKKGNNLKNKLAKTEAGKIVEKKVIVKTESPVKEKKDTFDKPKEQASSSIVKNIPLNLPSTSRPNPKPVLMVSDEDDEDFINIRADAEADLLGCELQEEVRPPQPQKQPTEVHTVKSTEPTSQKLSNKSNTSSQERSPILSAQSDEREPAASTQKDVRPHYMSEEKTVVQKGSVKSVTTKPLSVKRTPAIPTPEPDLLHSRDSIQYQEKEYEGRSSEVQRAQPVSKITAVYHTGSIKSRLGKKPVDKQDSPPPNRTKAKGVTSIVKVKGRPKIPLAAQASKNLILKAVADAQKSVASSLIRPEPVLKSQGLLTKKNRSEFSKIAVTFPNPRTSSSSQPVRRTLNDNRAAEQLAYRPVLARGLQDSLQSQPRSMHSDPSPADGLSSMHNPPSMRDLPPISDMSSMLNRPMTNDLRSCDLSLLHDMPLTEEMLYRRNRLSLYDRLNEIDMALLRPLSMPDPPPRDQSPVGSRFSVRELASFNSHRTIQNLPSFLDLHDSSLSLPHLSQNRSQSSQSQTQSQLQRPTSQPQVDANQPQQPQSRSQLIQTQPQPDIVASLHEGQSTQTNICRAGGNTVERMTMTERVGSPNNVSMATSPMDRLDSEIECQCSTREDVRDLEGHASCGEANCMFSSLQEETPSLQEKPVSPVTESPVTTRPCSPQFFVTLSGYDPHLTNGTGRVMRGGLSEKSRSFLIPESDDMDIDQEYMDEGIGEEDYKQEVENVGDADMIDDDLEKEIHSSGPVILRKVAPETSDDADVPIKVKSSERCRFWPACRLGERCEFHHPTIPCKSFPSCKFGDKCLYIHPNCKFDAACTRKDCPFTHAIPRSLVIAPIPAPIRVPVRPSAVQCRFFPKCTNVNCKFYHPKPCRFGKACNKYDCPYMHEREQLPTKDKLKWICPTKA